MSSRWEFEFMLSENYYWCVDGAHFVVKVSKVNSCGLTLCRLSYAAFVPLLWNTYNLVCVRFGTVILVKPWNCGCAQLSKDETRYCQQYQSAPLWFPSWQKAVLVFQIQHVVSPSGSSASIYFTSVLSISLGRSHFPVGNIAAGGKIRKSYSWKRNQGRKGIVYRVLADSIIKEESLG